MSRQRHVLLAAIMCFLLALGGIWLGSRSPAITDVFAFGALVLFAICTYLGLRAPSPLNPFLLFSLTPLSLLAYNTTVSPWYLRELSVGTWVVAIVSMIGFVGGLVWGLSGPVRVPSENIDGRDSLRRHTIALLAIGLSPTVYGLIVGYRTLLSGDWLGMSAYSSALPLASTLMLGKYAALAAAIKSRRPALITATMSLVAVSLALNFNKSQLALLVVTLLVSLYRYHGHRPQLRRWARVLVILAVMIGILSVALFDTVRSEFDSTKNLVSKGAAWRHNTAMLLPYMYFVSSWANLDYVLDTQPDHTYGLWLVKPLIGYVGADEVLADAYNLTPYSSFNTFTFVTVQFKDFGVVGSAIISMILGLLVMRLYRMHLASSSPLVTAVYALNAVAVLEMFFSNHFFAVGYPVTIVVFAFAYYIAFVKPRSGAPRSVMSDQSSDPGSRPSERLEDGLPWESPGATLAVGHTDLENARSCSGE